ncbi:hypothetical protein AKJ09_01586 [Labilithrix luteola]|uniref:DUF2199 domain-containing protein n=2 Tax=Labilithrix luteola TaxID=1391654 RepID=A0A0K1PN32_9BACT|nr:hypothetical protein AKJ09_01586 [Labilithrix luteola]
MPTSFHARAPAYWSDALASDPKSELSEDQCVIGEEHFFIRGLLRLPIRDTDDHFTWGVWVSLSRSNFLRTSELWEQVGREAEPPMFGWLSTDLAQVYGVPTLNLETMVHTQPVGDRPWIVLAPTDHPLAVDQHAGITLARARAIVERLMHG